MEDRKIKVENLANAGKKWKQEKAKCLVWSDTWDLNLIGTLELPERRISYSSGNIVAKAQWEGYSFFLLNLLGFEWEGKEEIKDLSPGDLNWILKYGYIDRAR